MQTAPKKVPGLNKILRYMGRLDSTVPEDIDREFVLQYFLVDNTLSIRETFRRNSGIVGGNFLKRSQEPIKTNQGNLLKASEFFVGAEIQVAGFTFIILDSDEATLKFMESRPETFPYSDFASVMTRCGRAMGGALDDQSIFKGDETALSPCLPTPRKLHVSVHEAPTQPHQSRPVCSEVSADGSTMNISGVKEVLAMYPDFNDPEQSLITIMRKLGPDVKIETFVSELTGVW